MKRLVYLLVTVGALIAASCGGGSAGGADGGFRLIEFLESGQASIPRNRPLTFVFSASVAETQDFAERLKIENVQTGQNSNFSRAVGVYTVDGNRVTFDPRLPQQEDRGDAGFRADGNYVVFIKAGPDALTSEGGEQIAAQQEFGFDTNEFFEDPDPAEPPRALGLVALDITSDTTVDVSRLDPRPAEQALLDSNDLLTAGRFVEPGAGGAPSFSTPWRFDLFLSEPIDPATVNTKNIEMFEIFEDATQSDEVSPPTAAPGHFGDPVAFKVPINVETVQGINSQGVLEYRIRVIPLFTLVDDTRYRLTFSGNILGIDFRKTFIGDNGLTGDGQTQIAGAAGELFPEPGGLGYAAEFIVRDRPAITGRRTVEYDPLVDGINPEFGQTEINEDDWNSALYNPASNPSTAVGFLSAFGNGLDGDLAVPTGQVSQIDTGDTPNAALGNPFQVFDLNPNDDYKGNPLPGGFLTYDSTEAFELNLASLTVAGTLEVIGVNPIVFRVQGISQISGTIDISGGDGDPAGGGVATGGAAGAGGFPGGSSQRPNGNCSTAITSCSDFTSYLSQCGAANNGFPHSLNGEGPGRGLAGGENYVYPSGATNGGIEASGGGGASHATAGTAGEDRRNVGGSAGTGGVCLSGFVKVRLSSVIGVRGQPGPTYGDRDVIDVTLGGSGGGAGGASHTYATFTPGPGAGGSGGGGGGSLFIIAAGTVIMNGGVIDASGGDGGRGTFSNWNNSSSNRISRGAGGAGSGGNIVLISGDDLALTGALLDARGGTGGVRADAGTNVSCAGCNAGGDGGNGFIFLMDADGVVTGFLPGLPGEYDSFQFGVLTISDFNADRFSSIAAVTELFNVLAANPDYQPLSPGDVLATVNPDQEISIVASSARSDPDNPLSPEITTEIADFEVALVFFDSGSVVVEPRNDMNDLNPDGQLPNRDAFVRIRADFVYVRGVESALGPFASIDRMDINFTFN